MQQIEWVISQAPEPVKPNSVGEISGIYAATNNGSECVLMLWHTKEGFVHGSFTAEDETLEVRGGFSPKTGAIQGYLLEPFGMLPVAMFSAQQTTQGLSVEVGVLEFESLLESTQPEHLEFTLVPDLEV